MNALNNQFFNTELTEEFKSDLQEQVEDNYEKIISNSARFIHDFNSVC